LSDVERRIVNVAFGPSGFMAGQQRLSRSLKEFGEMGLFGDLPPECPPHSEVPYAFKPYAVMLAWTYYNFDQVLWLDSSAWLIAPIDRIWAIIERNGHMLIRGGYTNVEWFSDEAMNAIGTNREELATQEHLTALMIGFDFRREETRELLRQWKAMADARIPFAGTADPAKVKTMWRNDAGQCSADPRVRGYRHDQSCLSYLAAKMKLPLVTCEEAGLHYLQPSETVDGMRAKGKCVLAAGI
jgi:hypothetical protein